MILKNKVDTQYNGADFAGRFNRKICEFLKEPVFKKGNSIGPDALRKVLERYNNNILSSTKMTLIQASKISNEIEVYEVYSKFKGT